MLETIPSIEESLNGFLVESEDETSIDADQLEEQQSKFESKMNDVEEILQKGVTLLDEIRNESSEDLQDVALLHARLERLQDTYQRAAEQWERKNETRLIDESITSFKHDSNLVSIQPGVPKKSPLY